MSQQIIEKLLKGAEVEWKPIDEIAEIYGGLIGKTKSDFEKGNAIYIPYKNIYDNISVDFNNVNLVNVSLDESQNIVEYGDILFTGSSETIEETGFSSVVTQKNRDPVYLNSFSFGVRINNKSLLIPDFSKYLFRSKFMRKEIIRCANGVTRFNLSKAHFKKIKIPIPSLSVQKEIVRILDAFTSHTAELTAELNERKKQYNYYRDKLLTFSGDEVEWKPLGETFNIIAGGDISKTELFEFEDDKHNIPVISNGIGENSIYGWTSKAKIKEKSLTISARGTIGWTNYHTRPFFPIVRLLVLIPKININLKYSYYYMKSIENNYKIPVSSIPQLTKPMLVNISMPIPSLERQKYIVSILDNFDVLTTSISEGLPREIELRNKQYEYYRDQLLNFPKPENDAIKKSPTNA